MALHPKTLAAAATVGDARAFFRGSSGRLALLVDGETFVAALTRRDVPDAADDRAAAAGFAQPDVAWVGPDMAVAEVIGMVEAAPERRVVVLGSDRVLVGLLCLNRSGSEFCR